MAACASTSSLWQMQAAHLLCPKWLSGCESTEPPAPVFMGLHLAGNEVLCTRGVLMGCRGFRVEGVCGQRKACRGGNGNEGLEEEEPRRWRE